jgi:hypothetical protein
MEGNITLMENVEKNHEKVPKEILPSGTRGQKSSFLLHKWHTSCIVCSKEESTCGSSNNTELQMHCE